MDILVHFSHLDSLMSLSIPCVPRKGEVVCFTDDTMSIFFSDLNKEDLSDKNREALEEIKTYASKFGYSFLVEEVTYQYHSVPYFEYGYIPVIDVSTNDRLRICRSELNWHRLVMKSLIRIEEELLRTNRNVLTIEDAALLTGLSRSHIYKLTSTKQIPYYKPNGKQIYFDRAELEAWMKQNRVGTISEAQQNAVAYVVGKGDHR